MLKRLSVGPDAEGSYIRLEVAARCPFIVFPVEAKAPTGRISAALLEKMHRVDNAAECK